MRASGHVFKADGLDLFSVSDRSVASVIPEAVLYTDDDPFLCQPEPQNNEEQPSHHKFVKTTPNPSATKKRRGELVGPPPPPPPPPEVCEGLALVDVADAVDDGVAVVSCGHN
jgi:hypothetical protein